MTTIRRVLSSLASVAFGAMLFSGIASATTISVTTSVFGNIPSFALGGGGTTSVSKFDASSIVISCPVGDTCSGPTLVHIDFILQSNTTSTLTVGNGAGTSYIEAINGQGDGTFGDPTSSIALQAKNFVNATDSITTNLVIANPVVSILTDVQKKLSCTTVGSPSALNFDNCLTVASGGQVYTGSKTKAGSGSYDSTDANWATVLSTYSGTGTTGFTLTSSRATSNGTLYGATSVSNAGTELAVTNGFEVDYTYTYTDVSGVPEPGTMVMAGPALLAAGLIRRRRSVR